MKNYLFTISEEERQNILDKHKTVYNGYATNQISSNIQPLHTQDFANDKGGITVKNDGSVSSYNNKIYMKEEKGYCSECGLNEELCECGSMSMNESECSECGGMMKEGECSECGYKTTGKFGKNFDYVEEDEKSDEMLDKLSDKMEDDLFDDSEIEEDECKECGGTNEEEWKEGIEYEEDIENIKESIQESLDWFKRFKKYN